MELNDAQRSTDLPLILTLKLDPETFARVNALRQQYFPPQKNFLPAHITLFHALPSEQQSNIQLVLQDLCSHTSVLSLTLPTLRFLGKGVAVEVDCPSLIQLRQQLVDRWQVWLTRQDQQRHRPHITLQNKVTPEEARRLYHQLSETWKPVEGYGEGLLLWYYKGGPWELADEFAFNRAEH